MLIFQNKLPIQNRNAVIAKINSVSTNLGIKPNWLMAVINFESAGTFSPSIQNGIGATGLIQFVEDFKGAGYKTINGTRYPIAQIKAMSFIEQLDLIEKYYRPYISKIKGFTDLYLATFFPAAIGKPDNYVLQTSNISASLIAKQNPVFDPFKTGKVTVGSIKKVILAKLPTDYLKYVTGTTVGLGLAAIGVVLFGFILYKNL